jgi:hypothetical protein
MEFELELAGSLLLTVISGGALLLVGALLMSLSALVSVGIRAEVVFESVEFWLMKGCSGWLVI